MGSAAVETVETILGVIRARRSIRRGYTGRKIANDCLLDILAAAVWAPSGSNAQAVRLLVETRRDCIVKLAQLRLGNDFLADASALVLVFQDRSLDSSRGSRGAVWRQLGYQDAAAAIQNMLLVATAYGLGACWVSAFANMDGTPMVAGTWAQGLAEYGLSSDLEIMGIVCLGHTSGVPAGDETHRGRHVMRGRVLDYVLSIDGGRP